MISQESTRNRLVSALISQVPSHYALVIMHSVSSLFVFVASKLTDAVATAASEWSSFALVLHLQGLNLCQCRISTKTFYQTHDPLYLYRCVQWGRRSI